METIVSIFMGLAICAASMLILGVMIMTLIWWMFHHNMDFEDIIDLSEWEEQE